MHLAEKLGYTLSDLASRITEEELGLWLAYFELEEDKNRENAKRR
jgi:Na+/melibiose symporter-like transporter